MIVQPVVELMDRFTALIRNHLFHTKISSSPAVLLVVPQSEPVHPTLLVQIHQHSLLQLVLPVVDGDGIIMSGKF